jgi:hypothetical protein
MKGFRLCGLFWLFALLPGTFGQQVTRSWVGFENYFEEIAAGQPHVVIPFLASRQDEYDVAVRFRTIDGTAKAGIDYVAVDQEIIFHAGSPTRRRDVEVHLIPNQNPGDRTFYVKLDASFPAEVSQSRGQIPIVITSAPGLTFSTWRTNFTLSWRASATNFQLMAAPALSGPWAAVTNSTWRMTNEPNHNVTLGMKTNLFFQLVKQ